MAQTETIFGSAHWASALINGDLSGMDERETRVMEQWWATNRLTGADVVDCGEPFFSWSYGLHTGDDVSGGDLVEYTVIRR